MSTYTILYLEHAPEREPYKQAMAQVKDVKVDTIDFHNPDQFMADVNTYIKTRYPDLVVTDAFFLAEGQMHSHSEEEDGEYLLERIVATVRSQDRQRIRIAVLTTFSSQLQEKYRKALDSVDYLWDKYTSPVDFVNWQVGRIVEDSKRRFPDHVLVTELLSALDSTDTNRQWPWHDTMREMLIAYNQRYGEMDQIEAVKMHLETISGSLCGNAAMTNLFEIVVNGEIFNVAAKPAAFGHLRHVFNVFWLGYFLINSGVLSVSLLRHAAERDKSDQEVLFDTNAAWCIASLLHDVGLLAERTNSVIGKLKELLRGYREDGLSIRNECGIAIGMGAPAFTRDISILRGIMGEAYLPVFEQELRKHEEDIDHGIMSGVMILKDLGSIEKLHDASRSAAIAAALHNLEVPELSVKVHPIAGLLLFCDQIQAWERQTGQESSDKGFPLESAELSLLKYDKTKDVLEIEVDYLPFRYISPEDSQLSAIKKSTHSILHKEVFPSLEKTGMGKGDMPEIIVRCTLAGRHLIHEWSSRKGTRA